MFFNQRINSCLKENRFTHFSLFTAFVFLKLHFLIPSIGFLIILPESTPRSLLLKGGVFCYCRGGCLFKWPYTQAGYMESCQVTAHRLVKRGVPSTPHLFRYHPQWAHLESLRKRHRHSWYNSSTSIIWLYLLCFRGNVCVICVMYIVRRNF